MSHVIDAVDVTDVIDVIDVMNIIYVTDPRPPFAILGNRASTQMSTLNLKGERKMNGMIGYPNE